MTHLFVTWNGSKLWHGIYHVRQSPAEIVTQCGLAIRPHKKPFLFRPVFTRPKPSKLCYNCYRVIGNT